MIEFYKNKKVFITGHTGFKGSWLLTWLEKMGADCTCYALPPLNNHDLYNGIKNKVNHKSIIGDIRDKDKLKEAIVSSQPDLIFHLAAQPLVLYSYQHPAETYEVNVIGSLNLLNILKELDQKVTVVMVTTDKVYDNKEWHYPYRENDALGGYDPYSSSKACMEIMVNSMRNSFFNMDKYEDHRKNIVTARAGNVIGGGDWAQNRLIPDIIKSLIKNDTINVRNPSAIRPWQHVLEPLRAYLKLGMEADQFPEKKSGAWNFGPSELDKTVQYVVEKSIKCWGSGNFNQPEKIKKVHEASILKLDISKSLAELEWSPKWSVNQSIEKTIEWYKNKHNKIASDYELCIKDIEAYNE